MIERRAANRDNPLSADLKQIFDALFTKIRALEAENAELRAALEGKKS